TCHRDHKGMDHDLKRVADVHCTTCHKDLPASIEGTPKYVRQQIQNVSSFQGDHPEFRSLNRDPGKIKFNHKYHTTEGIILTAGGKPFPVAELADGPQKTALLARGQKPNDAVLLTCADCHTPETRDDRAWRGDAPVAGVNHKDFSREAFLHRRAARTL